MLAVDDNPVNLMVVGKLLQRLGAEATLAKGGREAVEAVEANEFDLVFMDCQMPEVDGFETTRRIRSLGHDTLPIVALTANTTIEDRKACFEAGMNDHLGKPAQRDQIARILERYCRR